MGNTSAFTYIITLVPLFLLVSTAQISDHCSVYLNSVLHAGGDDPPWFSPSQEFAFGFRLLRHDDDQEDLFLLSIWFNKIPGKTIVWSKNDHPVPEGSTIQLTRKGLTLISSKGNEIWASNNEASSSTTCGAMLDSGNFVLLNGATTPIWESFANPTDTILPSQTLPARGSLTCRQSETNYADGRFQLRMQEDGDLVLYSLLLPTKLVTGRYWASETAGAQYYSNNGSLLQLVFDEAGYIYIQQGKLNIHNITKRELLQGSKLNFYYMARLDFDGVFRLYNHPTRDYVVDAMSCTSLWSVVQSTPDDVCWAISHSENRGIGSGACGYNSFCVSSNGKPSCFCPEGYSLLDPLDSFRGCKPDFPLPSCHPNGWETTSHLVDFKELNNTDFRLTDYEHQLGSQVDRETCIDFCRRDCFCAAVVYYGINCWKKRFPLSNGRQSPTVNKTVFIKVPKNNVTSFCPQQGKKQSTVIIVVSALLGSSVFLNILLLMAIAIATFLVYHKKLLNLQAAASSSSVNGLRVYTYKELEEATGGFKEHLGRGSFGTVYKGFIPSTPRTFIAVKRLGEAERQGEKEFTAEVNTIGQTHHKNLVKLLGYCDEGTHRLLVYEYMSNGSLAGHLFGLSRPHWNQRKQIAFGIARGLTYLHDECSTQIIHCDIKPQNILLDEHFTPKISDFGLAKLLLSEQSRAALTNIRGTIGYFSPEWFRKASITVKVADFQSRDSLQSLVQYCIGANQGLRLKHETSMVSGERIPRCKQIIASLQNKPMPESSSNLNHCIDVQSFDKNLGFPQQVGNYKSKLKRQGRLENTTINRKIKARVCWTTDLHKKFVQSVDLLGGARKATPKAILTLMNCDGLTIFHIKSHLQKYRVAQLMSEATKENAEQFNTETHTGLKILEALKLQMDFQRLLHKQLESQKKLQLRIEEQAKQLRAMIQCQMS